VLTLNWTRANVLLATAVTLGLLAAWIGFAVAVRRWRASGAWTGLGAYLAFGGCVAAVSLVAVTQLSWHRQRPGVPGSVLGYAAHTPDRLHEAARRITQTLRQRVP
jgi:hypothetical protein